MLFRSSHARKKNKLWALYRPIRWYIWCAENYPELGFSIDYAQELEALEYRVIPKARPSGKKTRIMAHYIEHLNYSQY